MGVAVFPLLVCADDDRLDALLRVCAAVGREAVVAPDAGAARANWADAHVVFIDEAQAATAARYVEAGHLPRRPGVVVVTGSRIGVAGGSDEVLWRRALAVGASDVVPITAESTLADRLATPVPSGRVVAVIGARGGVGVTTLVVALAQVAAARRRQVAVVGADPYGPDLEGSLSDRWIALGDDRDPASVLETLADASYARDLTILDLPRSGDPRSVALLRRAQAALLVVPADRTSVAAGLRLREHLRAECSDVRVVVRGPGRLRPGAVCQSLRLPYAGLVRSESAVSRAWSGGAIPGSRAIGLRRAALRILDGLERASFVTREAG